MHLIKQYTIIVQDLTKQLKQIIMKQIAKAIIGVMKDVKGMEKNSRVGSGGASYNGTKDQDVKEVFNEALAKHGLCILPIGIEESTQLERWEEEVEWQGKKSIKQKQSVFTKVTTKYLLLHESGESIELAGYGHGVDPQDKGAGKATTYALKNCLLYTFLTPVGKIDDTETTHSNDIAAPAPVEKAPAKKKVFLAGGFEGALKADKETIERVIKTYELTDSQRTVLQAQLNKLSVPSDCDATESDIH